MSNGDVVSNLSSEYDWVRAKESALLTQYTDQRTRSPSTWNNVFKIKQIFHQDQDYNPSHPMFLGQCFFHENTATHINEKQYVVPYCSTLLYWFFKK